MIASQCSGHKFASPFFVGRSCGEIYNMNPDSHDRSGYYWITDPLQQVYCDMEHRVQSCAHINHEHPGTNTKSGYYRLFSGEWVHCKMACGDGNWKMIASINGSNCPQGWNNSSHNDVNFCTTLSNHSGCYPVFFSTNKEKYQKVCGKVTGFQRGSPDAFNSKSNAGVDGISITHGNPRRHIWTYAVGLTNDDSEFYESNCPCGTKAGRSASQYVGTDFYCDTANKHNKWNYSEFYTSTILWQTSDCFDRTFCCHSANQPWFYRQLDILTADDIEVRICRDEVAEHEDILINQLELYIQ